MKDTSNGPYSVLPAVIRRPLRWLLRSWSYLPRAQGYLYQIVEKWGGRLSNRPLDARLLNGATMLCDLSDPMQRQIYFLGAYEPIETYLFSLLLKPGMVVIDAGANVGQYTLVAALEVGPQGAVHAFEPVPRNYERLEYHVRVNQVEGTVHGNMLALWRQPETLHLSLSAEQALNSGAYTAGETCTSVDNVTCSAVTLDQYVRDKGMTRLDVMKMDIEGAEWFALQGGKATLAKWRPTILMELSRPGCRAFGYEPEQTCEFLQDCGYRMWVIGQSAQESSHLISPPLRDFSNVIFHARPLPNSVAAGWSLRTVRTGQARRGKKRPIISLMTRLLTPAAERW